MRTIVLVACCGKKQDGPAPARDLYQSTLFKKSRLWAEAHGDRWFILSALHGVVSPDEVIAPYDLTLNALSREKRYNWACRVARQRAPFAGDRFIVLAGRNYCTNWPEAFPAVERPLQGLGIGRQLAWLTRN